MATHAFLSLSTFLHLTFLSLSASPLFFICRVNSLYEANFLLMEFLEFPSCSNRYTNEGTAPCSVTLYLIKIHLSLPQTRIHSSTRNCAVTQFKENISRDREREALSACRLSKTNNANSSVLLGFSRKRAKITSAC